MKCIFASLVFQKMNPPWFWILLMTGCLLFLVLTYRDIFRLSKRKLAWVLLLIRCLGVLLLLAALVKPGWQDRIEQTEIPQLAVIFDNSQSMSLAQPLRPGDWIHRYPFVRDWIDLSPHAQDLKKRFEVRWFDILGKEIPPDSAALPEEPAVEQTDLIRALQSVSGRLRGRHAAGVLLISDGRDTTSRENYMVLEEYPLPVYTVSFPAPAGGVDPSIDLSVVSVDCPSRTLVHNTVAIKVQLRKDGPAKIEVPLSIERAGRTLVSQFVRFDEGAAEQTVNINYTPEEPGDFVLTAQLPPQAQERTTVNNSSMFKLRVEADPIRVLYIEGILRPEYKFLRECLSRDPDVDLISFVRSASQREISVAGVMTGSELLTPERLEKIHVVLLGDFEANMMDDSSYAALKTWVENGGGLMILGGYQNLSENGLIRTPLADLLPVEIAEGGMQQIDQPFRFDLTYEGRRHPAFAITGDMAQDARLWNSLPELKGVAAVKGIKPAATVLARHPLANPQSADQEGYIVLATQPFGKGVVTVLTADTTWRWSRLLRLAGQSDALYVRFWSQMTRWLSHRDMVTAQTALQISTDKALYQRGSRVALTVTRNPAVMLPGEEGEKAALELTIYTPDNQTIPLTPASDVTNVNRWTAAYFPGRGGRFQVLARLLRSGSDLANQQTEFLVEGSQIELEDPAPNPALMQQIARTTGGLYAEITDDPAVRKLVESLPGEPRITSKAQTTQIWNSPTLFIGFLILVTVEWIVRRRNQLI